MNNVNKPATESSVDESVSQKAGFDSAVTDVKDSVAPLSEVSQKTEIPMPSGPKTRQAVQNLTNIYCDFFKVNFFRSYYLSACV